MKAKLIWIGKTKHNYTSHGVDLYLKRLKFYVKTEVVELKDVKSKSSEDQKKREGDLFKKHMNSKSYNICLHEKGTNLSSVQFGQFLQKLQNANHQNVNFMIGGAFGFSNDILNTCNYQLSLSKMTLPHDLCRVVLVEQIYRAFSILKGEKYHNP